MAHNEIKYHGMKEATPKSLALDAGTFHKGLKFEAGVFNFAESVVGATTGGGKFNYTRNMVDTQADGVLVKAKGLTNKNGESASMEFSMLEFTNESMQLAGGLTPKSDTSYQGFTDLVTKADISENDYIDNFAWCGHLKDGRACLIIFETALVTSALEFDTKDGETSALKCVVECYADPSRHDLKKLPLHVLIEDVA